ncbi:MAG: hypothetical protein KatS3mg039_0204 [Candidatus Kapaibacterium sp.]|nr:MAG: hypothetical protein KatS3mg039_0204 [Candidatus Kapabacteria bacterium]
MTAIRTVCSVLLGLTLVVSRASAQLAGEQPAGERLIVRVLSAPQELDIDRRTAYYPFPFAPTDSIARVYRQQLARQSLRLDSISELDAFRRALTWVGTRWIHHSENTVPPTVSTLELLERALNGERFTCVEYARLLVDVLTAYGFPARMVGLSKQDIETRPLGARHVAVEAWSVTYHKWVFLDPQWGMYPCLEGQWLSAYELVSAIAAGKLLTVEFMPSTEVCTYYRTTPDEHVEQYRSFLASYTGYLDYPYVFEGRITLLMYICRDSLPLPLAFQGMPISGLFYTRSWQKAYGALDQTYITFRYTGHYQPQRGFTQPEYTLDLTTTMPWITGYQVRQDDSPWRPIAGANFRWQLHRGINTLEVRAIGWNGLPSRTTKVKVFWGLPTELSKLTSTQ